MLNDCTLQNLRLGRYIHTLAYLGGGQGAMAPPKVEKEGSKYHLAPPQSGQTKKILTDEIFANNSNENFESVDRCHLASFQLQKWTKMRCR